MGGCRCGTTRCRMPAEQLVEHPSLQKSESRVGSRMHGVLIQKPNPVAIQARSGRVELTRTDYPPRLRSDGINLSPGRHISMSAHADYMAPETSCPRIPSARVVR